MAPTRSRCKAGEHLYAQTDPLLPLPARRLAAGEIEMPETWVATEETFGRAAELERAGTAAPSE